MLFCYTSPYAGPRSWWPADSWLSTFDFQLSTFNMPNVLDLRRRIRSVRNTQQITRAMKMVAAARLRRAQERVISARPYADQILAVLGRVAVRMAAKAEERDQPWHPLLVERPVKRILLV